MKQGGYRQESLHNGEFRYTLVGESGVGNPRYTVTVTDGEERRECLEAFTDNPTLARVYLTLLASNAVSPLHLHDIWEDMNA